MHLGGSWSLAFGDPISESQATDRSTFGQCPAGGLKRPQMPGTEAVLQANSKKRNHGLPVGASR